MAENAPEKVHKEQTPKEKVPKEKVAKEKAPKEKAPKEKVTKEKAPKEKSWSLSGKLRMMVIYIIFVILLAFFISVYFFSRKERMDSAERESENLIGSISNGIHSDMEGYKELSRLIMVEEHVVAYLRAKKDDVDRDMINITRNGIFDILNVTVNVDSVFIFREDGEYMSTNRGIYMFDHERMETDEWKADILAHLGRTVFSINSNNTIFKNNNRPVITIGRAIYDVLTQRRTGLLLMNISDAVLEQEIAATWNDNVCILDTDGQFLAGNELIKKYYTKGEFGDEVVHKTKTTKAGKMLVSGAKMEEMPLVILCVTPLNETFVPFETAYVLVFLLLMVVIVVFVAGGFITRNITSPVFQLTSAMEKNREEGKLEHINVVNVQNEIGMLEDGYNNMIDHVNDLIKRLIENEKILQKAEMRVLHEQIKPHFLYNSLETIGFLAMDAGAEDVHAALETLGSFYRNFLSKGDREIPLKREICIVQDYLRLQKLRYGDILKDEYDIAENTKECIIPKLILQPLVENSIYHGIRLKGEEGLIKITSRMEEDVLHIYVRDTGVGMPKEQIDKVLLPREGERSGELPESFGLWGTIERIRCFCDDDDVVRIRSEEGEYTEVEFIIPQRRMERTENEEI